jgi:hypothetical protein
MSADPLRPRASRVSRSVLSSIPLLVAVLAAACDPGPAATSDAGSSDGPSDWVDAAAADLEEELVRTHGEGVRASARRGLGQVAALWHEEDGDREAFASFIRENFAADDETRDAVFARFEERLEKIDGHMNEISLSLRRQTDLDAGPVLPFDDSFAGYSPSAHLGEDLFANRIAFVALLNFPLTTLEERLEAGGTWTRREWAEARLAERFGKRVPGVVRLAQARAGAEADGYIAGYNIWTHHLVDESGVRLFPAGQRLLSHWNLRDELKAAYADGPEGLARQRTIAKVMERIVDQSIPAVVLDNPHVDWNPFTNQVTSAAVSDERAPPPAESAVTADREPDTRYAMLLGTFRAERLVDAWSPTAPTLIARRFEEDREIPEERVEAMFDSVLSSPLLAEVGAVVAERLGRPLEPHDIWYAGFRPRGRFTDAELDGITRARFPTAAAYERQMPDLLVQLGFAPARAREIASRIVVEPARGSGHAWGAGMRGSVSRLRTRVGPGGMDYKGWNIAVHEMGHNVEQTISLYDIDHYLLSGVPNTAFTEALAFVFQDRDMELLGLARPDARSEALQALDDFWSAAEIASVALVDMGVWHWMYDHPEAAPSELREATLGIARDVWNRYWSPVIGVGDVTLLAIYSHMIDGRLYLPDYPIGAMIAAQIKERMESAGEPGEEFERMARIGRVMPDLWMRMATGEPVGPANLLARAAQALE